VVNGDGHPRFNSTDTGECLENEMAIDAGIGMLRCIFLTRDGGTHLRWRKRLLFLAAGRSRMLTAPWCSGNQSS